MACGVSLNFAEEALGPSHCNSVPLMKKDTSIYKRAHSAESYKYKRPDAVVCAGKLWVFKMISIIILQRRLTLFISFNLFWGIFSIYHK